MVNRAALIGSSLFFLAAPGVVAGLAPLLITGWRVAPAPLWLHSIGALLALAGLYVLMDSFARFVMARGTPAPIARTETLVVDGLYRRTRNPMYVGVLGLIFGQALLFANAALIAYGMVVFLSFLIFVVFFEEARLERDYGDQYRAYKAAVPRWLPRLTPWRG